ncbi:MAG: hypothetical protein ACXVBK_17665 [Flavisolibacter sp.]
MLQKKYLVLLVMILMISAVVLVGCYKDKTVYMDAPAITRPVTFSQDIQPIFAKSCALSGCHVAGSQIPNLSPFAAYNSLITGNYINKTSPENSLIYLKMTGKKGTVMPPSGMNKEYNALMLAWIQQGANNN